MPVRALLSLAVAIGLLFGLNAWIEGPTFNLYYEGIIVACGISIVLAVALNIVKWFHGPVLAWAHRVLRRRRVFRRDDLDVRP